MRVVEGHRFVRGPIEWTARASNEHGRFEVGVYRDGPRWTWSGGGEGADDTDTVASFREALREAVVYLNYRLAGSPMPD